MTSVAPGTPNTPSRSRKQSTAWLARLPLAIVLLIACLVSVIPFYLMFVWATLPGEQVFTVPPHFWFGTFFLKNIAFLQDVTFNMSLRYFWNSFYISLMATVTTLFFCGLGGYAFAMFGFRGKGVLFAFILGTMLIPPLVMDIPSFLVMNNVLHWIGTPRALWFPGMANAFGIFLMRQYIISAMPKELLEAARLDGATEFGIFYKIVIPLIRPILATLGVVTFVGSWNNFKGALIMRLSGADTITLPLELRKISDVNMGASINYGAVMMMVLLTVVPLLILFLIASRQVISGLTSGAVKD